MKNVKAGWGLLIQVIKKRGNIELFIECLGFSFQTFVTCFGQ